jgi:tRNA A37 threonylcarbamoyladenosine modification protein TsaB
MSSLALLATAYESEVAVAVAGGHGELFVQQFSASCQPVTELHNAPPQEAARLIDAALIVGSGAGALVAARGWGDAREALPSAAEALRLPAELRSLDAKPIYARAPDARARVAA